MSRDIAQGQTDFGVSKVSAQMISKKLVQGHVSTCENDQSDESNSAPRTDL